jgi:hypothetical protein
MKSNEIVLLPKRNEGEIGTQQPSNLLCEARWIKRKWVAHQHNPKSANLSLSTVTREILA